MASSLRLIKAIAHTAGTLVNAANAFKNEQAALTVGDLIRLQKSLVGVRTRFAEVVADPVALAAVMDNVAFNHDKTEALALRNLLGQVRTAVIELNQWFNTNITSGPVAAEAFRPGAFVPIPLTDLLSAAQIAELIAKIDSIRAFALADLADIA